LPKRILTIDDDRLIQRLISSMLKRSGYEVLLASSVMEGLQIARAQPLDAITCDLFMPDLDGFALLEQRAKDAGLAAIPVLVISASHEQSDLDKAIKLGANGTLNKPFSASDLEKAVANILPT
jgi:CheY-like chemotaxis protein